MIIYIVDDNETNLNLLETVVRKLDGALRAMCFVDPLEALRACERRLPDVVAVDYLMPGIDGHEFVRRFRALPGATAIPIIMITATTERQVRRTALDLGVCDFFTKPIDPYETRARLRTIVALREREQLLLHNASHDPLTQLPNRTAFAERLQRAVEVHRRNPSAGFAVLFIDLDRFKVVNDSLGHLAGDELLVQIAARMRACVRETDAFGRSELTDRGDGVGFVARLGGDEFTILLEGIREPSDALRVANRIQEVLQRPFSIAGQELYAGASIGVTLNGAGYEDAAAVLRDADLAMYRAKSLGKGRVEIFDRTMHEAAMARLTLETDLRRALRDQEFVLHYQPIVDLATRQVAGFEALVRWRESDGRMVPPGEFIRVAEETGLIVPLGARVLGEACRQLRAWDVEFVGRKPLTMSVNVSPREFVESGFVGQVARILRETGVEARRVCLEITESATMGDPERAVWVLTRLRDLGVQLSVDDFGTGYSSLSYLHRFPLNVLKIDRSFVANIATRPEGRHVINSIVALARSMGLAVVAEGAEHEEQIEVLAMLGCDFGQGFVFHHPLDAVAATALLRARDPAPHPDGSGWLVRSVRPVQAGDLEHAAGR